jgi:hypothetical protein
MLESARCGFFKKRAMTRDIKLVFLHSVGNRTGTRDAKLVFLHPFLICGSRHEFRYVLLMKRQHTIFHAQEGPVLFP